MMLPTNRAMESGLQQLSLGGPVTLTLTLTLTTLTLTLTSNPNP